MIISAFVWIPSVGLSIITIQWTFSVEFGAVELKSVAVVDFEAKAVIIDKEDLCNEKFGDNKKEILDGSLKFCWVNDNENWRHFRFLGKNGVVELKESKGWEIMEGRNGDFRLWCTFWVEDKLLELKVVGSEWISSMAVFRIR